MRGQFLVKALEKRNEIKSSYSGFIAGLIVGILNAIYTVITTLLYKEEALKGMEKATSEYSTMIDQNMIFALSLVVLPVVIILLLSIIGIFAGILIGKFKNGSRLIVLAGGMVAGALFGLSLSSPSPDLETVNIIVGVLTGLLYVVLYYLFPSKKKDS